MLIERVYNEVSLEQIKQTIQKNLVNLHLDIIDFSLFSISHKLNNFNEYVCFSLKVGYDDNFINKLNNFSHHIFSQYGLIVGYNINMCINEYIDAMENERDTISFGITISTKGKMYLVK